MNLIYVANLVRTHSLDFLARFDAQGYYIILQTSLVAARYSMMKAV